MPAMTLERGVSGVIVEERVSPEPNRIGLRRVVVQQLAKEPERLGLRQDARLHRVLQLRDKRVHLLEQPLSQAGEVVREQRERTTR